MPAAKNRNKRKVTAKKRRQKLTVRKNNNQITTALLIGGVVLILGGFFRQWSYNQALAPVAAESETAPSASMAAMPKRILIENKLDISLDPAALEGKTWRVSPNNGTYLTNSARLGQGGNLIIYGHNLNKIFGNLKQVKVGDTIRLFNEAGGMWQYRVTQATVVNPKEVSWLKQTDIPVLTVYTCAGPFDTQRLIVRAIPLSQ